MPPCKKGEVVKASPQVPAWVMTKLDPLKLIELLRGNPDLAATVKLTVPLPLPLALLVIVIHSGSATAVHWQELAHEMVKLLMPPAVGKDWLVGIKS